MRRQSILTTVEEASRLIGEGRVLTLAGDETLLRQLPPGHWIGGTIPYFMASTGGETSRDKIFVTELPCVSTQVTIRRYRAQELMAILTDAPENGFSVVVIPANSEAHSLYAREAPYFDGMFLKPIIGWISGVHLDELGKVTPKVFAAQGTQSSDEHAVVLHVKLPATQIATLGIVNLFSQGDGDAIRFPHTGFSTRECLINGQERNLADYLSEQGIDSRLPLVADYCGAMVNVSIQSIDPETREVSFYAPVFDEVEYRIARPVGNYVNNFQANISELGGALDFSFNCILNYVYCELEGKKTAGITGPMTFGEIAYQLLNQTLVYLVINDN